MLTARRGWFSPRKSPALRKMSRRYRVLTAGLLQASAYAPVRSRIVPAATALPKIFASIINQLAE